MERDLFVHVVSGMLFGVGINEAPKKASAFGGIYRWKDGRNTPDGHPVLFEFENIPVYMRLTLGTETDADVDDLVHRAQTASAAIVTPPARQPWGYAGAFADPDGHVWMVRSAAAAA